MSLSAGREAWAIVDLGFGDAGKGAVTDWLVRARGASLVVRYNGGAQAGHNVVTPEGRHHTFSQFGAGHLAGAETLLGPAFLLHPLAMMVEAQALGADPWGRTRVDGRARVITPYQQAAGRLRERLRGAQAHGSCGVGVGECVADDLAGAETLRAVDLGDGPHLRRVLARQRERKRAELAALGADDLAVFDDAGLIDRVVDAWRQVARHLRLLDPDQTRAAIAAADRLVFEGAQGVLLDETWGFHPHTTWSDTTLTHALALADRPVLRLGVTRACSTRHGQGPFPTEGTLEVAEVHNRHDSFQGRFRTGALDGVLLRYAARVVGGVDGLAVSGLDRVPRPLGCRRYEEVHPELAPLDADGFTALAPGPPGELSHRERLGRWLREIRPRVTPCDPCALASEAVGAPIWLQGWGPSAERWRWAETTPCGAGLRPASGIST